MAFSEFLLLLGAVSGAELACDPEPKRTTAYLPANMELWPLEHCQGEKRLPTTEKGQRLIDIKTGTAGHPNIIDKPRVVTCSFPSPYISWLRIGHLFSTASLQVCRLLVNTFPSDQRRTTLAVCVLKTESS